MPPWASEARWGGSSIRSSKGGRGCSDGRQAVDPARYVRGLLAWQGASWLVLAVIGLGVWLGTLRSGLVLGNPTAVALWKSGELLAIALGAGIGSAQLSMACRLRGGCGVVRATAAALRALTVASGLVAGAVSVLLVGSVMELIVLNGTLPGFLPRQVRGRSGRPGGGPLRARRSRPDTVMFARIGCTNGGKDGAAGTARHRSREGSRPLHLIPGGACAYCDAAPGTGSAPTRRRPEPGLARDGGAPAVHRRMLAR